MTKDELDQIRQRSTKDTAEDDGHGWPNQAQYDPEYMKVCIRDRAALLAYIGELARTTVEPSERHITTVGGLERFPTMQHGLMDTDPETLDACKTCGAEAAYKDDGVRGHDKFCISVHCSNGSCGIHTPAHYKDRPSAAKAWNRKPVKSTSVGYEYIAEGAGTFVVPSIPLDATDEEATKICEAAGLKYGGRKIVPL